MQISMIGLLYCNVWMRNEPENEEIDLPPEGIGETATKRNESGTGKRIRRTNLHMLHKFIFFLLRSNLTYPCVVAFRIVQGIGDRR